MLRRLHGEVGVHVFGLLFFLGFETVSVDVNYLKIIILLIFDYALFRRLFPFGSPGRSPQEWVRFSAWFIDLAEISCVLMLPKISLLR